MTSLAHVAPEREVRLSPDEALLLAIERHKLGMLDDAQLIYEVLLNRWPDHPDVLNHLGVLENQRGNYHRARSLLEHALEVTPYAPGVLNNFGNVLLRLDQREGAEEAFRRSIALVDSPEAQSNLSRVLRRLKRWAESEIACRRALELSPGFGDAWHGLSLVLIGQGRVHEGVQAANKALLLLPADRRHRDSYARALVMAGELERAAVIFREWLAEEPSNPYVQHHLAACTGDHVPDRASDAYVEAVFDNFASTFDSKLARLRYRAPELVVQVLRPHLPSPTNQFEIADIGCGTGLCGPLIRSWARNLVGCDLSGAMLELAQRRGVYDDLKKEELVRFLYGHECCFDIVICADTLCYFGALDAVMMAARQALRPGGKLAFTVEALSDEIRRESIDNGYELLASGRYAQSSDYLERVLDTAGFGQRQIVNELLREEAGLPLQGFLVLAFRDG